MCVCVCVCVCVDVKITRERRVGGVKGGEVKGKSRKIEGVAKRQEHRVAEAVARQEGQEDQAGWWRCTTRRSWGWGRGCCGNCSGCRLRHLGL